MANKNKNNDPLLEKVKKGLKYVESSRGIQMMNPHSSATGFYGQLYNAEELENIPYLQGVDRQSFASDTTLQNRLFEDRYYDRIPGVPGLGKNADDLRVEYKKVLEDKGIPFNYTDDEISALSNLLGRQGAREYFGYVLRDGRSLEDVFPKIYGPDAEAPNKTPEDYLTSYRTGRDLKYGGQVPKFQDGGETDPLTNPYPEDISAKTDTTGMHAYYNPPIHDFSVYDRPTDYGDNSYAGQAIDFLYRNPQMFDLPIIGDIARNQAYKYASQSSTPLRYPSEYPKERGTYEGGQPGDDYAPHWNDPGVLKQYFTPNDEKTLNKATYKPIDDYYEFLPTYSVKGNFETSVGSLAEQGTPVRGFERKYGKEYTPTNFTKYFTDELLESKNVTYEDFIKNKKPVFGTSGIEPSAGGSWSSDVVGADMEVFMNTDYGAHKQGLGWDKEVGLPYFSVADAWDFEPTHYAKKWGDDWDWQEADESGFSQEQKSAYIQASLMHKAGYPYKMYDRYYFDPKTREYITDENIKSRRAPTKKYGGQVSKFEYGGSSTTPPTSYDLNPAMSWHQNRLNNPLWQNRLRKEYSNAHGIDLTDEQMSGLVSGGIDMINTGGNTATYTEEGMRRASSNAGGFMNADYIANPLTGNIPAPSLGQISLRPGLDQPLWRNEGTTKSVAKHEVGHRYNSALGTPFSSSEHSPLIDQSTAYHQSFFNKPWTQGQYSGGEDKSDYYRKPHEIKSYKLQLEDAMDEYGLWNPMKSEFDQDNLRSLIKKKDLLSSPTTNVMTQGLGLHSLARAYRDIDPYGHNDDPRANSGAWHWSFEGNRFDSKQVPLLDSKGIPLGETTSRANIGEHGARGSNYRDIHSVLEGTKANPLAPDNRRDDPEDWKYQGYGEFTNPYHSQYGMGSDVPEHQESRSTTSDVVKGSHKNFRNFFNKGMSYKDIKDRNYSSTFRNVTGLVADINQGLRYGEDTGFNAYWNNELQNNPELKGAYDRMSTIDQEMLDKYKVPYSTHEDRISEDSITPTRNVSDELSRRDYKKAVKQNAHNIADFFKTGYKEQTGSNWKTDERLLMDAYNNIKKGYQQSSYRDMPALEGEIKDSYDKRNRFQTDEWMDFIPDIDGAPARDIGENTIQFMNEVAMEDQPSIRTAKYGGQMKKINKYPHGGLHFPETDPLKGKGAGSGAIRRADEKGNPLYGIEVFKEELFPSPGENRFNLTTRYMPYNTLSKYYQDKVQAGELEYGGKAEVDYEAEDGEVVIGNISVNKAYNGGTAERYKGADMYMLKGATHAGGGIGIKMNGEDPSYIFSDRLNTGDMSYAKAASKFGKDLDEINQMAMGGDVYDKNTAERMGPRIMSEVKDLYDAQEAYKKKQGIGQDPDKMFLGGLLKKGVGALGKLGAGAGLGPLGVAAQFLPGILNMGKGLFGKKPEVDLGTYEPIMQEYQDFSPLERTYLTQQDRSLATLQASLGQTGATGQQLRAGVQAGHAGAQAGASQFYNQLGVMEMQDKARIDSANVAEEQRAQQMNMQLRAQETQMEANLDPRQSFGKGLSQVLGTATSFGQQNQQMDLLNKIYPGNSGTGFTPNASLMGGASSFGGGLNLSGGLRQFGKYGGQFGLRKKY